MSRFKSNHVKLFHPFKSSLDFSSGALGKRANCWSRKLSEMVEVYEEDKLTQELALNKNKVVYTVYEHELPKKEGHLIPVTTILHAGRVGDQFFMTKGHYHEERGTAEVYVILNGVGVLLMQTEEGEHNEIEFCKGDLLYIPPFWAHRMVNVSNKEPLIFYGVYPANAGHDYEAIANKGFVKKVIFEKNNEKNYRVI